MSLCFLVIILHLFPSLTFIASLSIHHISRQQQSPQEQRLVNQPDGLVLWKVSSIFGRLRRAGVGLCCWKIFLICSTQIPEATSVSLASCDRLRKPWGRSSTTVRLTGWSMSFSFLANITESSSKASRAEAWEETDRGMRWISWQIAAYSHIQQTRAFI